MYCAKPFLIILLASFTNGVSIPIPSALSNSLDSLVHLIWHVVVDDDEWKLFQFYGNNSPVWYWSISVQFRRNISVVCVVLKYFITPLAVLDSFTTHLALESVTLNSMVILYHNSVGFSMIQYGCVCEQYGSVLHSIFCNNSPYNSFGNQWELTVWSYFRTYRYDSAWTSNMVVLVNSMVVCYTVSGVTILWNGATNWRHYHHSSILNLLLRSPLASAS